MGNIIRIYSWQSLGAGLGDPPTPPTHCLPHTALCCSQSRIKMLPSRKRKKNPPGKKTEGKKEKVVKELCPVIPRTSIADEGGDAADIDTRIVFKCPNGKECVSRKWPVWRRCWKRTSDSGYTNPYDHLKRCFGSEDDLLEAYDMKRGAVAVEQGGTIDSFLAKKRSPVSVVASDCYEWILLITLKDVPITAVEDNTFRNFGKPETNFSYKRISNVIRTLTELVEKLIAVDIKKCREHGGKAAMVHDGWSTDQNEHYVGLFLSFCLPTRGYQKGVPYIHWTPTIVLLACSPMDHHTCGDDLTEEAIEAATQFNAEQQIEFIENTLDYYDVSLAHDANGNMFVVCQITDNAKVMKRIARLLEIPGVGCNNHKLNLEMEKFVRDNCKVLVEKVRDTMVSIKNSAKLKQLMKSKIDLQPLFYNDTRWYGKYFMFERWLKLREAALEVNSELEETNFKPRTCRIKITATTAFHQLVAKNTRYFECFHKIHCGMQTQMITLRECHQQLGALVSVLEADKTSDNPLFGCTLVPTYIQDNADIVDNPDFERGVVKIQSFLKHTLTDNEKEAVKHLKKANCEVVDAEQANGGPQINPGTMSPSTVARLQEERQLIAQQTADEYVDCSFILGSVAVVERLWSLSGHILTPERSRMLPINLEALLFLKENKRYWDVHLVQKALDLVQERERDARANQKQAAKATPLATTVDSESDLSD